MASSESTPEIDENKGLYRFIVTAAPKSGSTFIAHILQQYFATEQPGITMPLALNRHDLTPQTIRDLHGHSFSINLHMQATFDNVAAASVAQIALVGTWRNLADIVVSVDDHQFREPGSGPALFVRDWARYREMETQARYAFLIEHMLPWYVDFYLRWRSANLVFWAYERMVADPTAFFCDMILSVGPLEHARLATILQNESGAGQRLNIGRAGRAAELFNDENKRRLEEKLRLHAEAAQLEVLLWELPWQVAGLATGPLDGLVVEVAETPGFLFFISRGVRYPISRITWVYSRFGERLVPIVTPAAKIAETTLGVPLY